MLTVARMLLVCGAVAALLTGCTRFETRTEQGVTIADAPGPECTDIEAFAARLVDVATDYDYEPTEGPTELAERVDVVLRGRLTGHAVPQGEHLGYELVDVEVLYGDTDSVGETAMVSVAFNPHYEPASTYVDAIPPGAEVIAFAIAWAGAPGGLIADLPEGFMTACADGPPLGWVQTYHRWGAMSSLDDVAADLRRSVPEA